MPRIVTYKVHLSEEEFEILKALASRWLIELNSQYEVIDMLPKELQDGAREELDVAVIKAQTICLELGIEP